MWTIPQLERRKGPRQPHLPPRPLSRTIGDLTRHPKDRGPHRDPGMEGCRQSVQRLTDQQVRFPTHPSASSSARL